MKKRFAFLVLLALPVVLLAAAPEQITQWQIVDTVTIDSQYSTGAFECVDSHITLSTDSCMMVFTASGIATLNPGDRLYLAMGKDSANRMSASNLKADTAMGVFYLEWPYDARGTIRFPFVFHWRDSTETQTDVTDTFYLNAAVRGSSGPDKVMIEDLYWIVQTGDGPATAE